LASDHLFDVEGRVVIVTGGAGLLGEQYVHALSEAGAHAVIADLDGSGACRVAKAVRGADALPVEVDVTDPEGVADLVALTLDRFGHIDGLVNNAGIDPKFDPVHASDHIDAFETYPLDRWDQMMGANLKGMFLCSRAVAPEMLDQGQGAIVNVSSIYGMVGPDQRLYEPEDPEARRSFKPVTYTVTKSAIIGFTKYLATYWAGKGIRVNALSLGGVYQGHEDPFLRRYVARTPMGRMAEPDEYNGALIFLLSDASSYMTGSNLVIDGGWTAW
jgi:2-deoxy-D-gluconate 3-dehydrogenase